MHHAHSPRAQSSEREAQASAAPVDARSQNRLQLGKTARAPARNRTSTIAALAGASRSDGRAARFWRHVLTGCVLLAFCIADADAQERRRGRRRPADSQPATAQATQPGATTAAATTAAAKEDKEKDRHFAVINGVVHTVSGPVLHGATILTKNGKILRIGDDVPLPPDTQVLDAEGKYVYPGLIAVSAGGIHGGGDPSDTTDVFGLAMNIALAGGITTAVGGDTAAKLTFGRVDDMVVAKNLFVELRYDTSAPLAHAELRADLERIRDYLRKLAEYEREKATNKEAKEPDKDWIKGKYENYLKLLKREAIAAVNASDLHNLVDICDLAEKYGFRLVIRGAHEAWIVPTALARAGASAIITPRDWIDPDERLMRRDGSSIETGAILYEHGVPVAVIPGINAVTTFGLAGRDLLQLNMEAAFAVRGGMTNEQALRSITLDAARVLGLSDRIGSLEEGKDADLIVTDGDILSYMTHVHYTIVNGRIAYDKSKDVLYAHIRPDGKVEPVEFDDLWPRRLEWPTDAAKSPAP